MMDEFLASASMNPPAVLDEKLTAYAQPMLVCLQARIW